MKQILVNLDDEVPEDLGMIIPHYLFGFYPLFVTVLKVLLSTYSEKKGASSRD